MFYGVRSVQFGSQHCCHLVVVATSEGLTVWSILTLSIVWTVPLKLSILCKDPFSQYMTAFTTNNTRECLPFCSMVKNNLNFVLKNDPCLMMFFFIAVFVFSPKSSEPVFRYPNICPSGTRILSATFAPRLHPKSDGSWQASSQLYFIDSNQVLLLFLEAIDN